MMTGAVAEKCTAHSVVSATANVNLEAGARPAVASMLAVPQTYHLSQEAYDRLAAEHENLVTHGRTDIARKIQAARELGDLKENGDYHAAKEEQGKMEGRINHLAALLLDAEIVEVDGNASVQAGSVVTILHQDDDNPETYLIGSIEERRDDLEVMSPGSPLGAALMGRAVGDIVDFAAPGGTLKVEIIDIGS